MTGREAFVGTDEITVIVARAVQILTLLTLPTRV
jgi:hypothetical protein